jgi:TolB-like protein
MGSDEQKAVDMLSRNRSIHQSCIEKFNGTLIKEIGDGILASFSLASEAVRCAIEIQKECKEQGIPLKIGIHEGEMIFSGSDVIGDGVNIASRLQEDAQEGCINISATVYSNIKNKADIQTKFIGSKSFKNVDEEYKVYKVLSNDSTFYVDNNNQTKPATTEERSIIVLPFENISPDPDQEYFSDGLTEEIITDLSHVNDLLVISRSSAMTFKGIKTTIKEIANRVNVRYVLEGSVRKAGNNLRITAQLIDAANDSHLWAEKYTGILDDVFDIQEVVSRKIVDSLKLKLSATENEILAKKPIEDLRVYEYYLKANYEITRFSEDSINRAIRHLESAIDISGDNSLLYAGMAFAYWNLVNIGYMQEEYLLKAEKYVKKALKIDPNNSFVYVMLGYIELFRGKTLQSLPRFKKSLNINPEEIFGIVGILTVYYAAGKMNEAEFFRKRVMRLDPLSFPANWYNTMFHFYSGQYDLALQAGKQLNDLHPENPYGQFVYSLILIYNNRVDQAISIIDLNAKRNPNSIFTRLGLIYKYAFVGEKEKIYKEITSDFKNTVSRDYSYLHHLSSIFAFIGSKQEALDWLDLAIKNGMINYPLIAYKDPFLENIRNENRFKKLMEQVKYEWEKFET